MKKSELLRVLALGIFALPAMAAAPALTGFPFTNESLRYSILLPGGKALGQGNMRATKSAEGWSFELSLDAGLPGFDLKDKYTSNSNPDFCSNTFSKEYVHGSRKGGEKETIDRSHATVERVTLNGGGKSEFSVSDCMKDALTLLFYARRELGQGRVPTPRQVLFGGLYDARMDYAGPDTIQSGGLATVTDKVICSLKGPSSSWTFEIWFARDAARTPLLFRVPLAPGKFSMELVR